MADRDVSVEEAEAWGQYLDAVRGLRTPDYESVELWAWAQLKSRLKAIRAKSRKVKAS